MKPQTFSMEWLPQATFQGYTRGDTWNGWECPLFPFESARRIADAVSEYQTAFYDEGADEFVFEVEDDSERFGAVEVKDIGKLYPIGTGAWIWEKHERT